MLIERYLVPQVKRDLRRKMVFIGGPRQVGKTTLARSLSKGDAGYLNWDVPEHRERILKQELPPTRTWIFDEIHKYWPWRNYLKGLYDRPGFTKRILITGSVGVPLSINGLRQDLDVSHKTVSKWLDIFERLYAIFRLSPFCAPRLRAVKKEQKHYHADWTVVPDMAVRFENLVAAHLLKWVHFQQDTKGRDLELQYFRDVDGREVDFVVTEGRKPVLFLECKWADTDINKALNYLKERFPRCEAVQIHATGKKDYETKRAVRVRPAVDFLRTLV